MNSTVRLALTAAAAVIVALIGYQMLGGTGVGGPVRSEPPSRPSASPIPSPAGSPAAVDFSGLAGGGTELEPGPYVITSAAPVEVTITVPDRPYQSWPSAWYKALYDWGPWHQSNDARLGFVVVENLYADPCQPDLGLRDPAVGPSVTDLVSALGSVPGVVAGAPSEATVDGYAGQMLELTGADRRETCVEEPVVWQTTQGEPSLLAPASGEVVRVWVLDVEGTRLVILAAENDGFADQDALEALIDSIQIAVP